MKREKESFLKYKKDINNLKDKCKNITITLNEAKNSKFKLKLRWQKKESL